MNMSEIGSILQSRRKKVGLTQQELADLARVNINTIVSIEKGVGNPLLATVMSITEVLGLQVTID